MIPYISDLNIYANGYSTAIIKTDDGDFKTKPTENILPDTHPDYGVGAQYEIVIGIASKILAAHLAAYNAEKLAEKVTA